MINVLRPQSEMQNPYEFYAEMQREHPVYHDHANQIWAIYSYKECQQLLNSHLTAIPSIKNTRSEFANQYTKAISNNLVRLSNPPLHQLLRAVSNQLFDQVQLGNSGQLLDQLLADHSDRSSIDWVEVVGKKLPALSLLVGFGFSAAQAVLLFEQVESLTKIMLPNRSEEQSTIINQASQIAYPLVEQHLVQSGLLQAITFQEGNDGLEKATRLGQLTASFIGFLIQSYDASRGLLANTLLAQLQFGDPQRARTGEREYFRQLVIETLRFDSPAHNTRRVLLEDIVVNGSAIKTGETLLIVLAAANRDPAQFERPTEFELQRANNHEYLSFGTGAHDCLAKHYIVHVVADAMAHLFQHYPALQLMSTEITYEPLVNVRLAKSIQIRLEV